MMKSTYAKQKCMLVRLEAEVFAGEDNEGDCETDYGSLAEHLEEEEGYAPLGGQKWRRVPERYRFEIKELKCA